MLVPYRVAAAAELSGKQGGTTDRIVSALAQKILLCGGSFLFPAQGRPGGYDHENDPAERAMAGPAELTGPGPGPTAAPRFSLHKKGAAL